MNHGWVLWTCVYPVVRSLSPATPLGTSRKSKPMNSRAYKQDRLSLLATPLSTPRKPQPLRGRAARCAPHGSLPPVVRRCGAYFAGLPAQRLPLSVPPTEWWPGVARGGCVAGIARQLSGVRCGAAGAREQRVRGRAVARRGGVLVSGANEGPEVAARQPATAGSPDRLPRRCRRAPAEAGEGRGLRLRCGRGGGCCAVLSWRTERATAGRAGGESLSRPLSEPDGAERFRYVAQRPRAAKGFLGVCGAVKRSSVCA